MTTQECKCEDKNTDYHLKVCCSKINSSQEQLEKIIESKQGKLSGQSPYIIEQEIKELASAILSAMRIDEDIDIESICEKVHQAYCKYHLENKGIEYWTKGDYSKLTEEGKEYDRRIVRAVLKAIAFHTQEIIKFEEE